MGEPIHLTAEQETMKHTLHLQLETVMHMARNYNTGEEYDNAFSNMGDTAYRLALSLETPPTFTQSVLNGAEDLTPNDRDFYNHVHVVEDLLNYLEDNEANNPPVDRTLGASFQMRVHTNRWEHEDTYHLIRNSEGWYISHNTYNARADIEARPTLNRILEHDLVSYPYNLNEYMSRTWHYGANGATREQIQEQLNAIAEWISITERNKPYTL